MHIKNCKTCGAKLLVVKTTLETPGIKRIRHCSACNSTLSTIEIDVELYKTLVRSHSELTGAAVANADTDALMRKLLPNHNT